MKKRSFFLMDPVTALAAVLLGVVVCVAAAEKVTYESQGRRDPFVPLITPSGYLTNLETENNSSLRLEGIMYDPNGASMAIINGELLRVGDALGDMTVSSIDHEKVAVVKNNERIELELERED